MAAQWRMSAVFENEDQAKQAATMLVAMRPRAYKFIYVDDDLGTVWTEEGSEYNARDKGV